MTSMQTIPVGDICDSACQVGFGPTVTNVSANSGMAAHRHSQANRSNIRAPCAGRSSRLPTAKLIGEIISTAKAPMLKS